MNIKNILHSTDKKKIIGIVGILVVVIGIFIVASFHDEGNVEAGYSNNVEAGNSNNVAEENENMDGEGALETEVTNGLIIETYVGTGKIGFLNDGYDNSTFTMITDIEFNEAQKLLIVDSLANQIRYIVDSNSESENTSASENTNESTSISESTNVSESTSDGDTVGVVIGTHSEYDFAGLPIGGYVDGSLEKAVLNHPNKILVYDENTVFFTEEESNAIRGFNINTGRVFTLAGDIESGYVNGTEEALFSHPTGIARDTEGNIYVADTFNNVIRKIDTNSNVTLYAGKPESYGNVVGDLENALFNEPTDLFMLGDVLYICDSGNNMIKKIENGKVTIVAGIDTALDENTETQIGGHLDGDISVALLNYPMGIFVEEDGTVYVADTGNNRIKVVQNDQVTTLAGNGDYGNVVGNALQGSFDAPSAVVVRDGNIYVADTNNHTIKIIKKSS